MSLRKIVLRNTSTKSFRKRSTAARKPRLRIQIRSGASIALFVQLRAIDGARQTLCLLLRLLALGLAAAELGAISRALRGLFVARLGFAGPAEIDNLGHGQCDSSVSA